MNSAPDEKAFDYSTLDEETCKVVQACTIEIQSHLLSAAEQMIEIGERLQIVKEKLKHGQFQAWLLTEFNMNPRQARRIMLVAKQFKTDKYAVLKFAPSALYLLAEIQTPDAAKQEAISRAESGEKVTLRTAKEIVSRHKSIAGQNPTPDDTADSVKPHQTKSKKRAEPLELSDVQPLQTANFAASDAVNDQRAENIIIDILAITIPDESNPPKPQTNLSQTASLQFCIDDRIRILRRQHGEDKWTGCTAIIWEVTQNGWLRVDVEGHQGVKFTLKPEWVELMEELSMTEPTNPQTFSDSDPVIPEKPLPVRIPLEVEGKTIEIDGIINEVEVHYTHKGIAGTIMLPANRVIFSKA
jgi:hypothetical protein